MINLYIDENGYLRFEYSGELVHRKMAYELIYKLDRDNYPMRFYEYQVHHKDGNKLNNNPSNLEIITLSEHKKRHGL